MKRYSQIYARQLLTIADILHKAGDDEAAAKIQLKAARLLLEDAMVLAGNNYFRDALRLLGEAEGILKCAGLWGQGWFETHMARAIFFSRLHEKRSAKNAWLMAYKLAPGDAYVVEMGSRLGLVNKAT